MAADGLIREDFDAAREGEALHAFVAELLPIPRSLTGDGVRETLRRIGERIPLEIHEIASGTPVLDWDTPREWNVREAWIANPEGQRLLDFAAHPLHLMGYSVPVRGTFTREELEPHLHRLPGAIPYRTSYYTERWGFCLSDEQYARFGPGPFEVCIDATLEAGHLTYGECLLPGETEEEVLISSHVCHPGMCNDNLSGIAVATALAQRLAAADMRYSYRFLFAPGTIGAITWLAHNENRLDRIRHGLVLTGVGDAGGFTWKRTRDGCTEIDRVAEHLIGAAGEVRDFSPYGYDERQFNSPGFALPVGRLSRTPHGEYPEYHTSADDLEFVKPEQLGASLQFVLRIVDLLENNRVYRNLKPRGEPQLGKRGLFSDVGGRTSAAESEMALLWVLNQSDGTCDLLSIAERSGLEFELIRRAAEDLAGTDLVDEDTRGGRSCA